MIKRYATKEMSRIWSDQNKYETWKNVEIAVLEVLSEMGHVPKESLNVIKRKAAFSVDRINEIEAKTHHDVIAFLTNLAENIGPDSRFVHMGMTSSDFSFLNIINLTISPVLWKPSSITFLISFPEFTVLFSTFSIISPTFIPAL